MHRGVPIALRLRTAPESARDRSNLQAHRVPADSLVFVEPGQGFVPMKITVAFYGIPRYTAISAPSIETHLLAPMRAWADVTVVHHLWRIDEVRSARSGEHAVLAKDAYTYFDQFAGVVEPPEAFEDGPLFQAWKRHGDSFGDDFGSLRNLMHQLQSLRRVTALIAPTKPDVVVFARPDLQYHDDVPRSACRLASRLPRTCVVPIWNWWAGYNDRFAICGRSSYEAYGRRLDRALDFAQETGRPIHSEMLLKFSLLKSRGQILAIPLTASRVRADGTVRQENFNSLDTSVLWRGRRDRLDRLQCRVTRQVSRLVFPDASWSKA